MATRMTARGCDGEQRLKGIVAGMVGGLAGSWTMNQFQTLLGRATEGSQQPSAGDDEDATQKLAQIVAAHAINRRLSKDELNVAGPTVHYMYGTIVGGLYGALAERSLAIRALTGAAYGALLWAAGDEVAVPLFGLSRPSTEYPPSTHAQALAAHVVYGVTTEVVRRGVRSVL